MSEVAVIEPVETVGSVTLFGTDNPREVVQRAAEVAKTLADIVRKQRLVVRIGQSEHVRVEGWTLLGSMLGVFPIVEWTRAVMDGDTCVGWEARVEARTRNGEVVGAAEAECLRSEKPWSFTPTKGLPRDDYALKSMAQTRAVSKAMRLPLGFVMQLAGFDPTPAEEMPVVQAPAVGTANPPSVTVTGEWDGTFPPPDDVPIEVPVIPEPKRRLLRKLQKDSGVSDERLKQLVFQIAGVESSKLIPVARFDALCAAVKAEPPPVPTFEEMAAEAQAKRDAL